MRESKKICASEAGSGGHLLPWGVWENILLRLRREDAISASCVSRLWKSMVTEAFAGKVLREFNDSLYNLRDSIDTNVILFGAYRSTHKVSAIKAPQEELGSIRSDEHLLLYNIQYKKWLRLRLPEYQNRQREWDHKYDRVTVMSGSASGNLLAIASMKLCSKPELFQRPVQLLDNLHVLNLKTCSFHAVPALPQEWKSLNFPAEEIVIIPDDTIHDEHHYRIIITYNYYNGDNCSMCFQFSFFSSLNQSWSHLSLKRPGGPNPEPISRCIALGMSGVMITPTLPKFNPEAATALAWYCSAMSPDAAFVICCVAECTRSNPRWNFHKVPVPTLSETVQRSLNRTHYTFTFGNSFHYAKIIKCWPGSRVLLVSPLLCYHSKRADHFLQGFGIWELICVNPDAECFNWKQIAFTPRALPPRFWFLRLNFSCAYQEGLISIMSRDNLSSPIVYDLVNRSWHSLPSPPQYITKDGGDVKPENDCEFALVSLKAPLRHLALKHLIQVID